MKNVSNHLNVICIKFMKMYSKVQLIVGNRTRPTIKHELIYKRPKRATLQNKVITSNYF